MRDMKARHRGYPKRKPKEVGPARSEQMRRDAVVSRRYGPSAHYACGRKIRYETQGEAMRAAALSIRRHGGTFLTAYQCEYCGGWHLTSRGRESAPRPHGRGA